MKQPIKGQGKIKRKKPKLQKKWTPFTSTNHSNQEYGHALQRECWDRSHSQWVDKGLHHNTE